MLIVKGCINEKCVANKKKITYKEADQYCSKCGNKLFYVCMKCYTQLPDNSDKYCVRCRAEKQDQKDNAKKNALKIGGVVGTVGIAAAGTGVKVFKAIRNVKFGK